ncbi:MAG: PQQ-binding-like beta-propeller repeat protein [Planctomycetaceae bacterium]
MRWSSSARTLSLIGLIFVLSGGRALMAQTLLPVPPAGDGDNSGPMRERRLVQKLEQARELLIPREPNAKPDESQALRLLQTLLDDGAETDDAPETDDVFLDLPAGERRVTGRSLKSEARRLIGGMSPQGRQAYEAQVGKGARVQFEAALAAGDWPKVEEIARRFFHTSAGYDATITLGLRELDLGEPLAAASRFQEVRDWPAARAAREPLLSLRLALAWRLAGQDERCRTVLVELKKSLGERPVQRRDGGELALFKEDSEALDWFDRWAGVPVRPLRATGERRDEWPLMSGNAARNAIAGAVIPTEHVAWSQLLLDDDDEPPADEDGATPSELKMKSDRSPTLLRGAWGRVRAEVRSEIEQRRQMDRPAIIAAQPIVVGGTVIVRTLSQLRAFRLADGQPLWHSAMVEPELAEMLSDHRRGRTPRGVSSDLQGWLQQRVWEDVGHATLSSDGEFVFGLQEREANFRGPQVAWRGMFVTREFNKLIAIEVASGRLRWEIGGPRGDLELSGSGAFFLGPPLPWRGRLYVLTDDGIDVRLTVLDPRDGKLLWMQTLAASDPIWSGMVRDAGLSPTVAGDCVICPTGAGTIVAVDPVRRELRWQSVHREPAERMPRPQFQFSPFQPPNFVSDSSWQQSVAVAVRDRVLVAPPDASVLLCLDARDGHLLWQQPRDEGLFLAGVADVKATGEPPVATATVLIVAAHEVRAVRLSDGKPAWSRAVSIAPPAGRGVLIDGVFHLPQISGEVVSIEAATGRTLARQTVALKELLGNLIAAEGRLVSQSATHIAAFPELRGQQQALAKTLLKNPDDPRALAERGRMNLHLGLRARGLDDLRRAIALSPSPEAKQTLAGILLEELRFGQATNLEETIRELETLLDDPKQRLLFARLRAASFQRRGELLSAARELLKLADAWELSSELEISNGATLARQDRWIAGELLELQSAMPAKDRDVLKSEVETRLRTALESSGLAQLRDFLALFGWSDSASAARRELIGRLDARKHRHEFESLLLAEGGAFGTARLAQQWLSLGQVEMARPLIDTLATRFAAEPCLDRKTGRELAAQWRAEFADRLATNWPTQPLKSERVSDSEPLNLWTHWEWSAPPDAAHENWQLWRDAGGRALVARDSFGREQWRTKLPFENHSTPLIVGFSAAWQGRWLMLNLGERFLVLDTIPPTPNKVEPTENSDATALPEPRLMWQSVLFDRRLESQVAPGPRRHPVPIPGMPDQFRIKDSSERPFGRAAFIGHGVVCHQAGNRLIASELATGELLWMFDGLPLGCELSGDDRAVIATSLETRDIYVLSTLDGRLLSRHAGAATSQIAAVGRLVLTWTAVDEDRQLRLFDPLLGADVLTQRFPRGSLPCVSLGDAVAVLEPTGRLRLWSLRGSEGLSRDRQGAVLSSDALALPDGRGSNSSLLLDVNLSPIANVTHFVMLRDRERWLLLTHVDEPVAPEKPRPRISTLYFDHWSVHGPAFAFDRATGKQLWTTTLDWHGVQVAQPADSPALLLAARVHNFVGLEQRPADLAKFHVSVLDKRNGKVLPLESGLPPNRSNFADIRPNFLDKTIDVQIERDLHRLTFEAQK